MPRVTVLAGGVGAARFLAGLIRVEGDIDVTAVVNTGDDFDLHGLRICPDLDTCTYTLAGEVNPETGWGRHNETWTVLNELGRLGGPDWFRLGDKDLALHLLRTGRLAEGATLTQVTAEIVSRLVVPVRLLPMSDDDCSTRIRLVDGEELSFQEYFVGRRHEPEVATVILDRAAMASAGPDVVDAITNADVIVIAPSNPLLSIDPVLAVPAIGRAVRARRDNVVAVSPLIGGRAVKGPAARLMASIGGGASVGALARHYAGWAGHLVIDESDVEGGHEVNAAGMSFTVTPTLMTDAPAATRLASIAVAAGLHR